MHESSEKLNKQAIQFAASGSFDEAVACFKRALAIDGENCHLWYNLGLTYFNAGDLYGSKEALIRAISINDADVEFVEVFELLGLICFSLQEYEDAFGYYNSALDINDNNFQVWNNLGVLHFTQGHYEQAAECFETALSIFPYSYDTLFNLRDTYEELGNETGVSVCEKQMKGLTPSQN